MNTSTISISLPQKPQVSSLLRTLARRPSAILTTAVLALIIIVTVCAPWLAPYDPLATDLTNSLAGPSTSHWLGTDQMGRDVFSRMLFGGQPDLFAALLVACAALIIGVPLGMASGYRGGRFDQGVMRLVDLGLALPSMVIVLLVLAVFGNQVVMGYLALGLLLVPPLTRIIRANTLALRSELFIDAAKVSGYSDVRIIARHLLPRLRGSILVQASLIASMGLLFTTGLAYLGFGVSAPTPSWGTMIAEASQVIRQNPAMLFGVGGLVGLTVLCLGVLGDVIRDASVAQWTAASSLTSSRGKLHRRPTGHTTVGEHAAQGETKRALAPSSALLHVEDLGVSYGGSTTPVLTNVSVEVQPGEVVGLVGESGCGKSTLARAILGLLRGGRVTEGTIRFDGAELTSLTPAQMRDIRGTGIAFVSQEPLIALDPTRRIGSTLTAAVQLHTGLSKQSARAQALNLLEQVSFPDPERVFRLYPHEISGGMAQRVAIARALAGNPRLLIADEPTTALDVTVQAEILDLLRELRARTNLAILIVTHDWGVVSDVCDRAVVMYAGEVVEAQSTRGLFRHPGHPYTAGLLASSPTSTSSQLRRLPSIPGSIPAPGGQGNGCRFVTRCPLATASCSAAPIPLRTSPDGSATRCLHSDQVTSNLWQPRQLGEAIS